MTDSIVIRTIISELFGENAYVVHRPGQQACAVIDPGFDADEIQRVLDANHLVPSVLLNTHGHADHIAGNAALKRRWPDTPLIIGQKDADKLTDPVANLSAQFGVAVLSPEADRVVADGDIIRVGDWQLEVHETPGHTRGHVVYVATGESPPCVFSGDLLFQGSVGRTDFPDGDMAALVGSIEEKLYRLPDDAQVYSGHGPRTTIGHEKRFNPFVGGRR